MPCDELCGRDTAYDKVSGHPSTNRGTLRGLWEKRGGDFGNSGNKGCRKEGSGGDAKTGKGAEFQGNKLQPEYMRNHFLSMEA